MQRLGGAWGVTGVGFGVGGDSDLQSLGVSFRL